MCSLYSPELVPDEQILVIEMGAGTKASKSKSRANKTTALDWHVIISIVW